MSFIPKTILREREKLQQPPKEFALNADLYDEYWAKHGVFDTDLTQKVTFEQFRQNRINKQLEK